MITVKLTERQLKIISLSLHKHSQGIRPWAEMPNEAEATELFREVRDTYTAVQTAIVRNRG